MQRSREIQYIHCKEYDNFKGRSNELSWHQKLNIVLSKFGITTMNKGYIYIYFSMKLFEENVISREEFCFKELCETLGKRLGEKPYNVEMSIKSLVGQVYKNEHCGYINKVMGVPADFTLKIGPKHFIYLLGEIVFN